LPSCLTGPPARFRGAAPCTKWFTPKGPNASKAPGGARKPARRGDYFHVEDKAGVRFWLFRAGLYRGTTLSPPRWLCMDL